MAIPSEAQLKSAGDSTDEIHVAALAAARPAPGLKWLDIGCGKGDILRAVLHDHEPASLVGVDLINWVEADLRSAVTLVTGSAETALSCVGPADRVLLVEVLEHLEQPWTVLRSAAQKVRPGGWLVATTPNIANLRHRLELAARGTLTAFREEHEPHLSPILPHVTARILREEGLAPESPIFASRDVLPKTMGRRWPPGLHKRLPELSSIRRLSGSSWNFETAIL